MATAIYSLAESVKEAKEYGYRGERPYTCQIFVRLTFILDYEQLNWPLHQNTGSVCAISGPWAHRPLFSGDVPECFRVFLLIRDRAARSRSKKQKRERNPKAGGAEIDFLERERA